MLEKQGPKAYRHCEAGGNYRRRKIAGTVRLLRFHMKWLWAQVDRGSEKTDDGTMVF